MLILSRPSEAVTRKGSNESTVSQLEVENQKAAPGTFDETFSVFGLPNIVTHQASTSSLEDAEEVKIRAIEERRSLPSKPLLPPSSYATIFLLWLNISLG